MRNNKHFALIPTNPPIHLTYNLDGIDGNVVVPRPVLTNPSLAQGERFVCAQCGAPITSASLRIAVGGSHRHTVPSSFGLDQEIGCFSLAPGCSVLGHFALDFAKPADGQWRMGLCSTMRFTISGADSRKCPTTKKVAGALCLFNASNIAELLPFS